MNACMRWNVLRTLQLTLGTVGMISVEGRDAVARLKNSRYCKILMSLFRNNTCWCSFVEARPRSYTSPPVKASSWYESSTETFMVCEVRKRHDNTDHVKSCLNLEKIYIVKHRLRSCQPTVHERHNPPQRERYRPHTLRCIPWRMHI